MGADPRLGFPCPECRATFLDAEDLTQHYGIKHAGKPSARVAALVERDEGVCYWCDKVVVLDRGAHHPLAPTREHLVPKALNGRNTPDNIALAHRRCNALRGHAEARAFLRLMHGEAVTKRELWPHLFRGEE